MLPVAAAARRGSRVLCRAAATARRQRLAASRARGQAALLRSAFAAAAAAQRRACSAEAAGPPAAAERAPAPAARPPRGGAEAAGAAERAKGGAAEEEVERRPTPEDEERLRKVTQSTRSELLDIAERQNEKWLRMKERWRDACREFWQHYKHGTVELWHNIRESFRVIKRYLAGHGCTRRERRLVVRTMGDVFRVIPFSIFVIVPFMELLLPVALKLFPNMLPSTFDDPARADVKNARRLQAQMEMTKLLQDTLEEMAVRVKEDSKCAETRVTAAELADFVRKIRDPATTGVALQQDQLQRLTRLFAGDLTLDRMTRVQLVALLRFFDVPFGSFSSLVSDDALRIGLRRELRRLKEDDLVIAQEGVDSLSDKELLAACRSRGIRVPTSGADHARLRRELGNWIALSTQGGVSNSFLLMSRVLPLSDIREISLRTADDLGKKAKAKIDAEVEKQQDEEDQEDMLREINAEYRRTMLKQRHTRDHLLADAAVTAGKEAAAVWMGRLERLEEHVQRLDHSLGDELKDLKQDIEEYDKDTKADLEDRGSWVQRYAMKRLGQKVKRNIGRLADRLEGEEQQVINDAVRQVQEEGYNDAQLDVFKAMVHDQLIMLRNSEDQDDAEDEVKPGSERAESKSALDMAKVAAEDIPGDMSSKVLEVLRKLEERSKATRDAPEAAAGDHAGEQPPPEAAAGQDTPAVPEQPAAEVGADGAPAAEQPAADAAAAEQGAPAAQPPEPPDGSPGGAPAAGGSGGGSGGAAPGAAGGGKGSAGATHPAAPAPAASVRPLRLDDDDAAHGVAVRVPGIPQEEGRTVSL